jgi:4'-phosphopantetheinyl transferase
MNFTFPESNPEIHLWIISLNGTYSLADDTLSEAEKERAFSLLIENDRKRYISAHVNLRQILSLYLHKPPSSLQFGYSRNSKPYLERGSKSPRIYFSLSYREEYMLLGVSNYEIIGVDIEQVSDIDNIIGFTGNFFSAREQHIIFRNLRKEKRLDVFFALWTMKEAIIKSLDLGMSKPLNEFDVSPFLVKKQQVPDFDRQNSWYLNQVYIAPGYKAAYAVRALQVNALFFEFNEKNTTHLIY